jgi:hypothetical protein
MSPRLLSLLSILAAVASAEAQTNPLPVTTYRLRVALPVVGCSFNGQLNTLASEAPSGSRFRYLQPTADGTHVIIQFLTWKDQASTQYATFNAPTTRVGGGTGTLFCLPRTSFDNFTERVYDTGWSSTDLAVGVLVLPLKLRPSAGNRSFDYSKDITIGTSAGPRWRMSPVRDVYVSAIGGIGLSSVTLTSANTGAKVTQTTDRAAVTWTIGTMLDVDRFQIGAFLGQDRISEPNQADWIYHGKPWFSIGLGYSLFGAGPGQPAQGNTSQ